MKQSAEMTRKKGKERERMIQRWGKVDKNSSNNNENKKKDGDTEQKLIGKPSRGLNLNNILQAGVLTNNHIFQFFFEVR